MGTLEIRPRDGGADAAAFANELATAIAKHTGSTRTSLGTTQILHRL